MQIEVLYYIDENGDKRLKSETLNEYGDIDGAVKSVEDRISMGRKIEILATIVHNSKKHESISDIIKRLYGNNKRAQKKAPRIVEGRSKAYRH
ncbi:MAG: hypothetical protein Q7S53_03825 [bacterium]|nr:hypothetical protein [bacterium]